MYPGFAPESLPAIPGLDGVGKVAKHGPGTKGTFPVGTRVVAATWHTKEGKGSWAQYVTIEEDCLVAVPDSMSDEVACQYLTNPLTVLGFFEAFPIVKQGDWILNIAGNSALGQMVIKLAKKRGYKTITTVRHESHTQKLKELGADAVIVSTKEKLVDRVMEITGGKGAILSLDPVGGDGTADVASSTSVGGQVVIYGALADLKIVVGVPDVLFRDVKISGFWVAKWLESDLKGGKRQKMLQEALDLMSDGTLVGAVGRRFPLKDVGAAVRESLVAGKEGKVLLEG